MKQVTIALAKGRITKHTLSILQKLSIQFSEFTEDTRKLVITDDTNRYRLLFVKAVDVPTYVETGAADIGIVGKDVIMEEQKEVYELVDLKMSNCQIVIAGYPDTELSNRSKLIVATKYPQIAMTYFAKKKQPVEIIRLNGSIELAPLIGMSDVIVDIVETGTTLKENGLIVLEEIAKSSARIIVNKASYAIKTKEVTVLLEQFQEGMKHDENSNS